MNYLLSVVDMGIDELSAISGRWALVNYAISVDMGIDELTAISGRYKNFQLNIKTSDWHHPTHIHPCLFMLLLSQHMVLHLEVLTRPFGLTELGADYADTAEIRA